MRYWLLIVLVACQREQRRFEAGAAPPYAETAQNVNEGKLLYQRMNCVGCHHYGGGGMGPAFMDPDWRYGSSPDAIASSIVDGRKDGMPAYRDKLTGAEVIQLVAYVRSLGNLVRSDALPARDEHLKLSPAPTLEDLAIPHGSRP